MKSIKTALLHIASVRVDQVSNEDFVDGLMAITGLSVVQLVDELFETNGEVPWKLFSHRPEMKLYVDDCLSAHLDVMARSAKQEIDAMCAKALNRIANLV